MKTVLFDMDGVITSERVYWNCAGLTVAQVVEKYLNRELPEGMKEKLELAHKYLPDEMIRDFKSIGLGNNWDIAYVVSALYLMNAARGAELKVEIKDTVIHREFVSKLKDLKITGYGYLDLLNKMAGKPMFTRMDDFWNMCKNEFQKYYEVLKEREEPIIPLSDIAASLNELRELGVRTGVVTGRPYEEIERPLREWGLLDYFDKDIVITDREVVEAEKELESRGIKKSLSKPNPYTFLRAILGKEAINLAGDRFFDIGTEKYNYIIVGDSVADALGAKELGVPMIGVLTGANNEDQLMRAGANFIARDLREVPIIVKREWSGRKS